MEQNGSPGIPGIFSPSPKDHFNPEPYKKYFIGKNPDLLGFTIIGIALGLKIRFANDPTAPTDEVFDKIIFACERLDERTFETTCLKAFKTGITKFCRNSNDAWGAIGELLSRELEKKERSTGSRGSTSQGQSITKDDSALHKVKTILEGIQQIPQPKPYVPGQRSPEPNPDLKNLPTYGLIKHYALVRKTTVFDFILEQSGNLTFAKVHTFIQHNGNYKVSSRGKVVYDGSFSWIARELSISIPTVWRAFAWMKSRKLVTKIGPQDHRIQKNSRWYVCTSMAQNLKLWSMAYRSQGD